MKSKKHRMRSARFVLAFGLAAQASVAAAMGRPRSIEIDGTQLSAYDSAQLIYGRAGQLAIPEASIVKLNGRQMIPFALVLGESIFLRTEEGGGDSSSYEAKLSSPRKTAITCGMRNSPEAPAGVEIKRVIALAPGQAALAMTYDDAFKVNGELVNLYLCPREAGGASPGNRLAR